MTTTTDQSKPRRNKKSGFSLVEMMISMTILLMVLSAGLSAVSFIGQSCTSLTNYSTMSKESRQALEEIARDLRMGFNINSASATKLDFDIHGKAGTTQNLVYEYNPNEKKLYRTEDLVTTETMLEDMTSFQFNFFNLRRESTTAPISVKEVQVEGLMTRKALVLTNTNYIISARYMMRNRSVSD